MFLNKKITYTQNIRNQFLIALLLGILVTFIIIFLHPYGAGLNEFPYKNLYFIGYGFLTFLSYFFSFFIFHFYYKKVKKWKWLEELLFVFIFVSLMIIAANIYTELVVNKKPVRLSLEHFLVWYQVVFFGFGILIGVVTILLRKHFAEEELKLENTVLIDKKEVQTNEIITIKSTLKKDFFKVEKNKIVYIKSEDNYVYVFYLDKDALNNKMLRSTLSNIQNQVPFLLKTHRSYLVNPKYIEKLKGNSQNAKLYLSKNEIKIPVSKTYYSAIKNAVI